MEWAETRIENLDREDGPVIDTIFRCEICGEESDNPVRWVVIDCSSRHLTVYRWDENAATAPGARHYCGEAHAQVYISRWFQSNCGA